MTRKRCTGLDSKQWGFSVDFGEEDAPPGRDPKLRETLIKSSLSTGSITRQTHRITGQLRERNFLRWRSRPFAPDPHPRAEDRTPAQLPSVVSWPSCGALLRSMNSRD